MLQIDSGSLEISTLEGKRMASSLIGNEVPRMGLWVRVPCPPLDVANQATLANHTSDRS